RSLTLGYREAFGLAGPGAGWRPAVNEADSGRLKPDLQREAGGLRPAVKMLTPRREPCGLNPNSQCSLVFGVSAGVPLMTVETGASVSSFSLIITRVSRIGTARKMPATPHIQPQITMNRKTTAELSRIDFPRIDGVMNWPSNDVSAK